VRLGDGSERGITVSDVELDRQDGVARASTSGASVLTSRAVAATRSPRFSAASVHTGPTFADAAAQRASVVEAVRRLTAPQPAAILPGKYVTGPVICRKTGTCADA
jgi:hypothetical protein